MQIPAYERSDLILFITFTSFEAFEKLPIEEIKKIKAQKYCFAS